VLERKKGAAYDETHALMAMQLDENKRSSGLTAKPMALYLAVSTTCTVLRSSTCRLRWSTWPPD